MSQHIAIVGAGQAAASLALDLRKRGFDGRITMFGNEPHLPYQRPPLSKKYLSGEWGAERLYLRDAAGWADLNVEIRSGAAVTALDVAKKTLTFRGEAIAWDKLALTTGAAPRPVPPPFAGLGGVYDLRNLGDVDLLRAAFRPGAHLVVIGGGFIGLETAAVAAKLGLHVTVIERVARIMERAVGPATSAFFHALHQAHGVRILASTGVASVTGTDHIRALTLNTGETLAADLVLVGIGVLPSISMAEAAGLATGNGVLVDEFGRTSAPDVWAAGDCAAFPLNGQIMRLESVQNAINQAEAVAADMMGAGVAYHPVPWFWSDQYDAKLQISGLFQGYTNVVSRRSAAGESHWYFQGDRLIAVEAINDGRAYMIAKKLLAEGTQVSAALLADEAFDPRSLLV